MNYKKTTFIKQLNGHSGCDVCLLYNHNEDKKFVRKVSSSCSYNDRLLLQMTKQNMHSSNKIFTPLVYTYGYDSRGLFYYDMEFIIGRRLDDLHISADHNLIDKIFDIILSEYEKKSLNEQTVDCKAVIHKKVNSLRQNIELNKSIYDQYFDVVLSGHWEVPTGQLCHGDLTLENIIYSDNKIFFIDFLDSFLETYLMDIAKLIFDLKYFWSWRNLKRKPIVKNILMLKKIEKSDFYLNYKSIVDKLVLLHIIRIIPYSKSEENINFLNKCLENEK